MLIPNLHSKLRRRSLKHAACESVDGGGGGGGDPSPVEHLDLGPL